MAELKCNNLPFKTIEEWEAAQKDEPDEALKAIQKSCPENCSAGKLNSSKRRLIESGRKNMAIRSPKSQQSLRRRRMRRRSPNRQRWQK
jgi:hypothetical protein